MYVKLNVKPRELEEFFVLAHELNFKGISVTMPLKEAAIPYLNELSWDAQKIGSVNTIAFINGKSIGYNTDGVGALDAIENQISVKGKKIVVLGAGGTARAIVYEALKRNAQVTVLNRTEGKALKLADRFACRGGDLQNMSKEAEAGYDIIINATSDELPIGPEWILPGCLVMDLKTKPKLSFFKMQKKKGVRLSLDMKCLSIKLLPNFKFGLKTKLILKKLKPTFLINL